MHHVLRTTARGMALSLVGTSLLASAVAADGLPGQPIDDVRNNVGVAYDPMSDADFNGAGDAFSGLALELAGVTPGAQVTAGGMDFVWPDTASGEPDNVVADGQVIAVPPVQAANRLGILAAAHGGEVSATLRLTYVDAAGETSVEEARITVLNWQADPTATLTGGDADVESAFYVVRSAVPVPIRTGLDAVAVPLDPGRTLVSVELPDDARLHVFDLRAARGASGGGDQPPAELPVRSTVVALPAGNIAGFAPTTVPLIAGQPFDLVNLDPTSSHDVVSVKRDADYKRLFVSASVPAGGTARVEGAEKLEPGSYDFVCSIHGAMTGTLTVQAAPVR